MNVENEFEILKYQIKLLQMIVGGDAHPFFMYLIDYGVSREQHALLMDVLYVFNHRFSEGRAPTHTQDEVYHSFFESKKISLQEKIEARNISSDELFSGDMPTYAEFETLVTKFLPNHLNPLYLLKSLRKQEIYADLCDCLLVQKKEKE